MKTSTLHEGMYIRHEMYSYIRGSALPMHPWGLVALNTIRDVREFLKIISQHLPDNPHLGIVIDMGNPGVFSHIAGPLPARTRTLQLRVAGTHGFGMGEGGGLNPWGTGMGPT